MVSITLIFIVGGLSYVSPACDPGWAEFQGECLLFSKTQKNWLDAEADCRKRHSYLATDDNQEKHNFITTFTNVLTGFGIKHFWLGGSDYTFENSWRWLETGGSISGFSAWLPGQPSGNQSQNCLATVMNGTQMFWDDITCFNTHVSHGHTHGGYNYICEKPDPDYQPGGSIIG